MKSSNELKPSPKSFLFIGPPGGGKTTLALTIPGPVHITDIDMNIDGPVRVLRQRNPKFEFFVDQIPLADDGKPVPVEQQWDRLLRVIQVPIKDPNIKVLVIDGLSTINHIIIQYVLSQNKKSNMERQDWIPFRNEVLRLIAMLRNSGKTTAILCHEEWKSREEKGQEIVIKRTPAMDSKLKDYFGGFFTDMIRCCGRPAPLGKTDFFAQCTPTSTDELKNSVGIAKEINVTEKGFAALNEYYKLV